MRTNTLSRFAGLIALISFTLAGCPGGNDEVDAGPEVEQSSDPCAGRDGPTGKPLFLQPDGRCGYIDPSSPEPEPNPEPTPLPENDPEPDASPDPEPTPEPDVVDDPVCTCPAPEYECVDGTTNVCVQVGCPAGHCYGSGALAGNCFPADDPNAACPEEIVCPTEGVVIHFGPENAVCAESFVCGAGAASFEEAGIHESCGCGCIATVEDEDPAPEPEPEPDPVECADHCEEICNNEPINLQDGCAFPNPANCDCPDPDPEPQPEPDPEPTCDNVCDIICNDAPGDIAGVCIDVIPTCSCLQPPEEDAGVPDEDAGSDAGVPDAGNEPDPEPEDVDAGPSVDAGSSESDDAGDAECVDVCEDICDGGGATIPPGCFETAFACECGDPVVDPDPEDAGPGDDAGSTTELPSCSPPFCHTLLGCALDDEGDLVVTLISNFSDDAIAGNVSGTIETLELGADYANCWSENADCGRVDFLGEGEEHTHDVLPMEIGDDEKGFTPRVRSDTNDVEYLQLAVTKVFDPDPEDGVVCDIDDDQQGSGGLKVFPRFPN